MTHFQICHSFNSWPVVSWNTHCEYRAAALLWGWRRQLKLGEFIPSERISPGVKPPDGLCWVYSYFFSWRHTPNVYFCSIQLAACSHVQNQTLNVTTLQPSSLTANVLTTEYPEAQVMLATFSVCLRIAVPYTSTWNWVLSLPPVPWSQRSWWIAWSLWKLHLGFRCLYVDSWLLCCVRQLATFLLTSDNW